MDDESLAGTVEAEGTVLLNEEGEPIAAQVTLPESEEPAIESEAVAIANIEAEKEIAITAINAGVEEARIEADKERVITWQEHESELEALKASITEQSRQLAELQALLLTAQASQLSPTPEPEPEALPVEIVPETNLTPQSTPESETQTVLGSVEEGGEKAVETLLVTPARKLRRLI